MFQDFPQWMGCLNWPGVGTRVNHFYQWIVNDLRNDGDYSCDDVFGLYAEYLGRVTSYRALALTVEQYETICNMNSIWPTGRLKTDAKTLKNIINQYGVFYIAHARLYIGQRLVEFDPSLSLHDDPETATCIASSFLEEGKKVYLMELSVPKIEVLGYHVKDVQDDEKVWFKYNNIYFDATKERTERYTLYEIPFYNNRLKSLRVFESVDQIENFTEPFRKKTTRII